MPIFPLSKSLPKEEAYALTDQVCRSSRSVCANLAEAWRKRRYEKALVSKLSDSEGEVAETRVWIAFAARCEYIRRDEANEISHAYNQISRTLVGMIKHHETWITGDAGQAIHEESEPYGDHF